MAQGGSQRGRRRARELLIQALYQHQLAGHGVSELMAQFGDLAEFVRIDQAYFSALLEQVLERTDALDALIAGHADRGLEQLDAVDRAVLWLALTELEQRHDVPTNVVINEAVELAKRYGPVSGFRFVNAMLDRIAPSLRDGRSGSPS
jgi:N utilization substance protein B